jgi:hypothetical protein
MGRLDSAGLPIKETHMSTITELLQDQTTGEKTGAPAGTDSNRADDPCCNPPGPDPGPDR